MWTHIHSVFHLFWAGSCCGIHTCTGHFPNRHTCVHSRHSLQSKSWPLENSHKQTATLCFLNAPLLLRLFGYNSVRSTQTFDCQIDCNGKLRFSVFWGRKTFIVKGKLFWIKSSLEFEYIYILTALEGSHSFSLALWMMMFPCRVWAGRFTEP